MRSLANHASAAAILLMLAASPGTLLHAGTYSSVQSPLRPFGLDIVDRVQVEGSDARALSFKTNYLPTMRQWGTMDLTSPSFTQLTSTVALDPSKIKLLNAYDTRVYFIGDNTSKQNSLGFNTGGGGINTGDPLLIFPNASQAISIFGYYFRTQSAPLAPGDFTALGTLPRGTDLDFFLISKRTSSITDVFSTDTSINPDAMKHALVFAKPGSPYLFIGFEDLYNASGSSKNYKDVLFTVDIGLGNVTYLISMPEPSTMLILGSFLMLVVYRKFTLEPIKQSSIT